jgi:hypothetical protein
MSRDHVEVGRLTEELARLRASTRPAAGEDLRRVLYGLHALVSAHFAKEEEIYLPLLEDRLSAAEAHALFERMEAAAGEARIALAEEPRERG